MRIIIATPFYPPESGILGTYAEGLEGAFTRQGHEVNVVVLNTALPAGLRHLVYFVRIFLALRGAAFVLSLDTWSVGVPALYAAKLRRVPFLVRIGGDFLWEQYLERTHEAVRLSDFYTQSRALSARERRIKAFTQRILSTAHAVMFNTQFQKEIWEKAYDLKNARVLENFYPEKNSAAPPSNRVFVSAHRGAWYKNTDCVAEVFARIKKRHPNVELDTRQVPHKEQMQRLASSYAVIIPSISEVGSNFAIEAVSFGKPFIMSDDTGTSERLADCGLFIDTRSAEALEEAIEQLLDPVAYKRYADACTAFSFSRSWETIARDIIAAV